MKHAGSSAKIRPLGPHSRSLTRGAIGDAIDGRSREGRFLRQAEAELLDQIGGEASFGQRLLIRRVAKGMLQLELFDSRISGGQMTAHDARAFSALGNQVRLGLRDLGLRAAPKAKPPTLAEYAAGKAAQRASGASSP